MFRLTAEEWGMLSQIVMASEGKGKLVPQTSDNHTSEASVMRSHFVTASIQFGKRNKTHLPYAFTEHGVTMLASVLKSDKAIDMNIAIVRAFIALRQFALNYKDLADQVNEIRETVANHDEQLNKIYAAIEALSNEKKLEQQAWEERRRIGFER